MRLALALVTALGLSSAASAQRPRASTALYLEAGGPGLDLSVNAERRVRPDVSVRRGVGAIDGFETDASGNTVSVFVATVPLVGYYLPGRGAHRAELGAGVIGLASSASAQSVSLETASVAGSGTGASAAVSVGYRYHRPRGGVVARVALSAFAGTVRGAWPGLPLGYAF